jgi:hypothetical protein
MGTHAAATVAVGVVGIHVIVETHAAAAAVGVGASDSWIMGIHVIVETHAAVTVRLALARSRCARR